MTKRTAILTACLVTAGAATLGAQSSETKTKTKIEVEHGKSAMVRGCVETDAAGAYSLTRVTDKTGTLHSYTLVSDKDDFSKVVGRRVQIEGTLGDRNHGKVEIKTETKVDGPTQDTRTTTEGSGAYLGVKHMKTIAGSCK